MFMLGSNHFLQVNFGLQLLEVKGNAIAKLLALFGGLGFHRYARPTIPHPRSLRHRIAREM